MLFYNVLFSPRNYHKYIFKSINTINSIPSYGCTIVKHWVNHSTIIRHLLWFQFSIIMNNAMKNFIVAKFSPKNYGSFLSTNS